MRKEHSHLNDVIDVALLVVFLRWLFRVPSESQIKARSQFYYGLGYVIGWLFSVLTFSNLKRLRAK